MVARLLALFIATAQVQPAVVARDRAPSAAHVVVAKLDVTGVDISVQRTGSFTISGSVVSSSGRTVDSFNAIAYPLDIQNRSEFTVSSGGRFEFRGMRPGSYLVKAWTSKPLGHHMETPVEVGYRSVEVVAGDVTDIVVQLSRSRMIAGAIDFEGGGPPPPDWSKMFVVATELGVASMHMVRKVPATAWINENLMYHLSPLFDRPFFISMNKLPAGWVVRSVNFNGRDIRNVPTNFGRGPERSRVDITLTNCVATPSLLVTDEHYAPVQAYTAIIFPTDQHAWMTWQSLMPDSSTLDGTLKLEALLPGDYFVAAIDAADASLLDDQPTRIEDLATVATRVTFIEGDSQTVPLKITNLPKRKR